MKDLKDICKVALVQAAPVMFDKKAGVLLKNIALLTADEIRHECKFLFAAQLLISEDLLQAYSGCTQNQFCDCTGYPMELIELRLK